MACPRTVRSPTSTQDIFTATPLAIQGTIELSWLTITYGASPLRCPKRLPRPHGSSAVAVLIARPRSALVRPHGERTVGFRGARGAGGLRRCLRPAPQARADRCPLVAQHHRLATHASFIILLRSATRPHPPASLIASFLILLRSAARPQDHPLLPKARRPRLLLRGNGTRCRQAAPCGPPCTQTTCHPANPNQTSPLKPLKPLRPLPC